MDAPRGQLLADSSFSVNENRGVSGCDRTNLLQNLTPTISPASLPIVVRLVVMAVNTRDFVNSHEDSRLQAMEITTGRPVRPTRSRRPIEKYQDFRDRDRVA